MSLPLYEEMSSVIRGQKGFKELDLSNAKAILTDEELSSLESKEIKLKPIPNYWLQVLLNAKLDEL